MATQFNPDAHASQARRPDGFFRKAGRLVGDLLGLNDYPVQETILVNRKDTYMIRAGYEVSSQRTAQKIIGGKNNAGKTGRSIPNDNVLVNFLNEISTKGI